MLTRRELFKQAGMLFAGGIVTIGGIMAIAPKQAKPHATVVSGNGPWNEPWTIEFPEVRYGGKHPFLRTFGADRNGEVRRYVDGELVFNGHLDKAEFSPRLVYRL